MSVTQITALVAGLTSFAGVVAGIVAMFRHVNGPKHNGTP